MKILKAPLLCLSLGFLSVLVIPPALSAIALPVMPSGPSAAPIPAPQLDAIAVARREAQAAGKAACDALTIYDRVVECSFVEWNPSIDVVIKSGRLEAGEICDRASRIIAEKVPDIVGKWVKVRVFLSAVVPPSAACRLG